jgi:hypothetical protein
VLTICAKRVKDIEEMGLTVGPMGATLVEGAQYISVPELVVGSEDTPVRVAEYREEIVEDEDHVCREEVGFCKYCHVASMEAWTPDSS